MKPLAKLTLTRQRLYRKASCGSEGGGDSQDVVDEESDFDLESGRYKKGAGDVFLLEKRLNFRSKRQPTNHNVMINVENGMDGKKIRLELPKE